MQTRCLGEIKFDKRQAWQWQIPDFGEHAARGELGPANVRAVHRCHACSTRPTTVALQGAMTSLTAGEGGRFGMHGGKAKGNWGLQIMRGSGLVQKAGLETVKIGWASWKLWKQKDQGVRKAGAEDCQG